MQSDGQEMPGGELVTSPEPSTVTVSGNVVEPGVPSTKGTLTA